MSATDLAAKMAVLSQSQDQEQSRLDELLLDAAAAQRLLEDRDFKRWQELMTRELGLLLAKFVRLETTDDAALRFMQGAMAQQEKVLRMPQAVLERGAQAVEERNRRSREQARGAED